MSKRSRPAVPHEIGSEEDFKSLKPSKKRAKKIEIDVVDRDGDDLVAPAPDMRLPIKNGFRMLPVRIGNSPFIKYWYFREQKSASQRPSSNFNGADSEEDVPEDARSLFITNIGPDCSENDIRSIFGVCGDIEAVRFDSLHAHIEHPIQPKSSVASDIGVSGPQQPSKGQEQLFQHRQSFASSSSLVKYPFESHGYALVVFSRQQSLLRALNGLRLDTAREACEKGSPVSGAARWISEYRSFYLQSATELQGAVDSFMKDYDKRKRQERKMAEELATVTDEDGWTVVVRRGKKKASQNVRGKDAVVGTANVSKEELLKRKEKETNKLIENFYRFQKQEEKRKRLDELRRQFEIDKRRIAKIKNSTSNRKFKPT
eukprot:TRINITY_DN2548_c0_g1_i1.p1 TRINITY_DN2548_c0_g1~~TRINITY_DN2548_c0_g1_i1.p1  ORF type:complete len:373 (+),score=69.16 TRINITY_DN2548_c0_g1_i1:2599-3717(+)